MPFLGNTPANTFVSIAKQTITGNSGTTYTLSYPVTNANEIDVFYNNVRQEPTVAYTASGTTITFTEAIASTDSVYVIFNGQAVGTINPSVGSVALSTLDTGTVDTRYVKKSGDTISGQVEIQTTSGSQLKIHKTGVTTLGQASIADFQLTQTNSQSALLGRISTEFISGWGGDLILHTKPANGTPDNAVIERVRIDNAGRVTQPYQPFFTARQPANQSSTGGTGFYFHNYSDVIQNVGGHFNTSTGRFTAPITGVYLFRAVAMGTDPAEGSPHCGFSINGNANTGGGSYPNNTMWEHPNGAGHKTDTMHIIKLNANDNIRFIQLSSVALSQTDRTFFMGYLLG